MDGFDEQVRGKGMKILVICIQRIGDVLLTTPLIHSLRMAYSQAAIDVLVCQDSAQILHGNEDINQVIEIQRNSKKSERLKEIKKLWNQYDMSITTMPSDRVRIYGWAASKLHYGTYLESDSFLFKKMMSHAVKFDNTSIHTVEMNLKICEMIGIAKLETVVTPQLLNHNTVPKLAKPYAVIHPYPKFIYKEWHKSEWKKLIKHLLEQGLNIYISGGNEAKEIAYCEDLVLSDKTLNLSGKVSFSELAEMIKNAEIYIGVDTSVTHLAAATGVKVIAIYGPTNPVKWGPWPSIRDAQRPAIWLRHDQVPQHHSNITLIQGQQSCVPCAEEGCEKHIDSESKCLTSLTSAYVIQEVDKYLRSSRAAYAL